MDEKKLGRYSFISSRPFEVIKCKNTEENPLEVDAYDEINRLMLVYFHGLSTGDIPMVEETVDVLTEEEIRAIEKKKDYIESYNDITCYTKKGMEEDTFVVFASSSSCRSSVVFLLMISPKCVLMLF